MASLKYIRAILYIRLKQRLPGVKRSFSTIVKYRLDRKSDKLRGILVLPITTVMFPTMTAIGCCTADRPVEAATGRIGTIAERAYVRLDI